jgi:hypothetical protein
LQTIENWHGVGLRLVFFSPSRGVRLLPFGSTAFARPSAGKKNLASDRDFWVRRAARPERKRPAAVVARFDQLPDFADRFPPHPDFVKIFKRPLLANLV